MMAPTVFLEQIIERTGHSWTSQLGSFFITISSTVVSQNLQAFPVVCFPLATSEVPIAH